MCTIPVIVVHLQRGSHSHIGYLPLEQAKMNFLSICKSTHFFYAHVKFNWNPLNSLGDNVYAQKTDRQDRQGDSYIPLNFVYFVCGGIVSPNG